jgi:hypothetical protein
LGKACLSDRVTVYSVIGNVFAYACIAVCAAAILLPAVETAVLRFARRERETKI